MEGLDKAIAQATKELFEENPLPENEKDSLEVNQSEPVDYYQQTRKKIDAEKEKSYPRGTSTLTKQIAEEAIDNLNKVYRRAKADADYLNKRKEQDRANIVKQQYIEENFLPTVEMLVISATPDEILNSKEILKALDDLSMEYGPGYTASYIRTAYGNQLGNASSSSDGYVRSAVERLKFLADSDQIRAAYGVAKKLKEQIDNGEHLCSDEDYEIITRVASIM